MAKVLHSGSLAVRNHMDMCGLVVAISLFCFETKPKKQIQSSQMAIFIFIETFSVSVMWPHSENTEIYVKKRRHFECADPPLIS